MADQTVDYPGSLSGRWCYSPASPWKMGGKVSRKPTPIKTSVVVKIRCQAGFLSFHMLLRTNHEMSHTDEGLARQRAGRIVPVQRVLQSGAQFGARGQETDDEITNTGGDQGRGCRTIRNFVCHCLRCHVIHSLYCE